MNNLTPQTNALIFYDHYTLRYLYENLIDDTYYQYTDISQKNYDSPKFTFNDFVDDLLNIESETVLQDVQAIYEEAKFEDNYLCAVDAEECGFVNWRIFRDHVENSYYRDDILEDLITRLQKIIKKDAVNKISNFFLKCKYSPNTKYGRKYIQSLYDENL